MDEKISNTAGEVLKIIKGKLGASSLAFVVDNNDRFSLQWKNESDESFWLYVAHYSASGDTLAQAFASALELVGK